jgi:hypothetical protein
VRVYDVASGALTVPFASDRRDEVLWALGADGTMLINRWRAGAASGRVLQKIGLDGRARGRAVRWAGIEARQWSSSETVSPDGRFVAYRHGKGRLFPVRVELARTADGAHRAASPYFEREPSFGWSPDGRTLVIAGRRNGRWAAWTLALADRRARRRVALARPPTSHDLAVAPGATRFAYDSDEHQSPQPFNVVVVDLVAGTRSLLQPASIEDPQLNGPLGLDFPQWSPAGDLIAVKRMGTFDLELLDPAGTRRIVVPIDDGFVAKHAWSPDGLALAYVYEARDRQELRVYDLATGATRVLMSHPGSRYVYTLVWSADSSRVGVTMAG